MDLQLPLNCEPAKPCLLVAGQKVFLEDFLRANYPCNYQICVRKKARLLHSPTDYSAVTGSIVRHRHVHCRYLHVAEIQGGKER